MNKNYITNNIRKFYFKHIFAPIILLAFIIYLHINLSVLSVFFPKTISSTDSIDNSYETYVNMSIDYLYNTGYEVNQGNLSTGTYYYTFINDKCLFVLLPTSLTANNSDIINDFKITGKLIYDKELHESIMNHLSVDLNWTSEGLEPICYNYFLSASYFVKIPDVLLGLVCVLFGIFSVLSIIRDLIAIICPIYSPPVFRLGRYGTAKNLLQQVDEELSTLPQLATEDMFITEHFFIEVSAYGITIVPINEIIWIYKNSTLQKRFGIQVNILYTLHISAKKNVYFNCPKNIKSDIDGIIEYLEEANHDILVGFSQENKRLAKSRSKS